jgi:hypothetical protein
MENWREGSQNRKLNLKEIVKRVLCLVVCEIYVCFASERQGIPFKNL